MSHGAIEFEVFFQAHNRPLHERTLGLYSTGKVREMSVKFYVNVIGS